MTTYPISKIRSGEVAVKLTSIEQYVKLCEIVDGKNNYIPNYSENKYHGRVFGYCIEPLENHELFNRTLIDFHQIDWEEGKEEVEKIAEEYCEEIFSTGMIHGASNHARQAFIKGAKWQKEQLDKELSTLKAENERLKGENTELGNTVINLRKNYDEHLRYSSELELKLQDPSKTSQNQELTLKQRMAWELYVAGFNHGIADKWTIAECYRSANIFLNHKGGENE